MMNHLVDRIRFKPYRVDVLINTPRILMELGLDPPEGGESDSWEGERDPEIKTAWESAVEQNLIKDEGMGPKLAAKWAKVWGAKTFTFYELRPGFFETSDSDARYSSSIQMQRSVDPITFRTKPDSSYGSYKHPAIFFGQAGEWYTLELRLHSGWKDDAAKLFPNAKVTVLAIWVNVELARIPVAYIKHMPSAWERSYSSRWQKRDVKWNETLKDLGWEDSGGRVSHKYMSIWAGHIR